MTIKSEIWIIAFNLVILFALLVFFRRQISKGRINENKFAILFCVYMSLLFLAISLLLTDKIYTSVLILVSFELLLIWSFGFLFSRWVFQKLNARNHP